MLKQNDNIPVTPRIRERVTEQYLMPIKKNESEKNESDFDLYPSYDLGDNTIFTGYGTLGEYIAEMKVVCLEGFSGIDWDIVVDGLLQTDALKNLDIELIDFTSFLKPENEIQNLVRPFLGEEESVWGTRTNLSLSDFFDSDAINEIKIEGQSDLVLIYGFGASLIKQKSTLIYFEFPKNELQYRMRAGEVDNLGITSKKEDFKMYKHYYFIDWVVMGQHKAQLADSIDVIVDAQHDDVPSWAYMTDISNALSAMSRSAFRVRPWFEPGAWGGEWIKTKIDGLNKEAVNYAWAFSLIVPENGLLFESDGNLLEISFDFLMNQESLNVLGAHKEKFGTEFPIRFNFLDTYNGGNLSIQCHPSLEYIQEVFGENITQDECYYILDCDEDANVYLGFQNDINPAKFKKDLIRSQEENMELDITEYVQEHKVKKHDFFLIPNGTVHSAGAGNMVLEISATPYIFTFKMYDWLRLDLNGKPRPINIDHAFNNLKFERQGEKVKEELFSHTTTIEEGEDFVVSHFPTHAEHFYDVRRLDFKSSVTRKTNGSCQVMMLVEGEKIRLETKNGFNKILAYAETFVIPMAADSFTLTNLGQGTARVINAFLK
ncbi:MAG: hypothetical protein CL868_11475 [Cytophagaceae bacterium]|nr:hypothetical protein [Cytophagaceae bacterium]